MAFFASYGKIKIEKKTQHLLENYLQVNRNKQWDDVFVVDVFLHQYGHVFIVLFILWVYSNSTLR